MDEYSTNGVEMRAIKCMEHDSLAGSFGERCNCDTCYQATRIEELEAALRELIVWCPIAFEDYPEDDEPQIALDCARKALKGKGAK